MSARFAHPNVLPTLGYAEINGQLAIISPWMRNGNVVQYTKLHPEADRVQLV